MPIIPGEALGIAICEMITEIVKGQPPEIKAELWKRYLEFTQPLHDLFVSFGKKELK